MTVWLRPPRRVALLSVHTSPLEQPGTGDAGGMNVYIAQTATRMAERGIEVDVFTRATSSELPPVEELAPGVLVRHVEAGPFEVLDRNELPAQLCAFTASVLRTEANNEPGFYDLVHSHYWLSGQVGWLARDRWGVPLVHTAHTLAKVKNAALAEGDTPEPRTREIGEQQVVDQADSLVANTEMEAGDLLGRYDADPDKVFTVFPGVDLEQFTPGSQLAARSSLGIAPDATVYAFVGRIQPLKAPDVLLYAAAELLARGGIDRSKLVVLIVGGPSGTGLEQPRALQELAVSLGIADVVRFLQPLPGPALAEVYRAADVVVVPSHNESFGLVALEAQACGTPVAATDVGGLRVVVDDGVSGLLVPGHSRELWADALTRLNSQDLRDRLSRGAVRHARGFSWDRTTDELVGAYMRAAVAFREVHERTEVAS
ncbi:D-inositol-3-phosphate glycosyltransferase [Kibdelosporangium banguiense]|uniref:D-inositol-3-phosphate glycosyltransferase n=1 Tax=Kibdelosporangium banguiense TaxID=1365924 RepID=A0ABS4TE77_9PSEU|nr:D-inositol-3-phosphate glycosyltransferase [Kibdelosporangium banguiense]MBP2322299.1 D-inositol-3-phosphate glycosyltransferase [Kibdelosporangium banguiense]